MRGPVCMSNTVHVGSPLRVLWITGWSTGGQKRGRKKGRTSRGTHKIEIPYLRSLLVLRLTRRPTSFAPPEINGSRTIMTRKIDITVRRTSLCGQLGPQSHAHRHGVAAV